MEDMLADIEASQAAESALYVRLKNTSLSDGERAALIQKINAESVKRAEAFSELTEALTSESEDASVLSDALRQQLEALHLVETQLKRTKTALEDKRLEARKMAEITAYSGKQYEAYASFLAATASVVVLVIVAGWLAPRLERRGVPFTPWLPRVALLGGIVYLLVRGYDLLTRRNDVFDEYAWPTAPRTLKALDAANMPRKPFEVTGDGLPTLCAGSYCCADGTEWVSDKGCVVAASPPKKSKGDSTLDGQELTAQLKKAKAGVWSSITSVTDDFADLVGQAEDYLE